MFLHRWLGVALCLLVTAWFASGIVMMYARMPELTAADRLARAPALDLSTATIGPGDAARVAGVGAPQALAITMVGTRPAYRFPGSPDRTVMADDGSLPGEVTRAGAEAAVRLWFPECASSLSEEAVLAQPDQWTLELRQHLPLHRIALGDAGRTRVYVSGTTGDLVMKTTARERAWAYAGPVVHWLYVPIIRRRAAMWSSTIIWLSSIACVLALTGLVAGVIRWSPRRRYRLKGDRSLSPYAGWLKWHHVIGLMFGIITLTWLFSGLLSMGPFSWISNRGLSRDARERVTGPPASVDAISLAMVRAAVAAFAPATPRELTLVRFDGVPYWFGVSPAGGRSRLVEALHPDRGTFARFGDPAIERAADRLVAGIRGSRAEWLTAYDGYYYDRAGERPLPVQRVRLGDRDATWVYLDPSSGRIALVQGRLDRLNRWLYHGLHSFDIPGLYNRRPAWDIVVILLSLGGLALSVTSLVIAWRYLVDSRERRST